MEPGETRNALSQLRRGVLEYCVLALLSEGERYGFELVRTLSDVDGMVTSEGTIYPLLSRLRREALVTTTWRESESGPPRRYYVLTDAGRRSLGEFTGDWVRFRDAVDSLLPLEGTR
jgi:PadR family transcriptional regulator PadR